MVTNEQTEEQASKHSNLKLDLYDASVDKTTWKAFKKSASLEELTVIAIGAKYRLVHSRLKNIIYALGMILSIVLFWQTGGYSLIGYPVFSFLATKSIRYQTTLDESYSKLTKEYKAVVDGYYHSNVILLLLDVIIKLAIFWITIPYQAVMMLISVFAPNFAIAKNGILVSIPRGYDIENLGAIGAYYASFNFTDEALNSGKREYTYTNSFGIERKVYSKDGKDFYDANWQHVGSRIDDRTVEIAGETYELEEN